MAYGIMGGANEGPGRPRRPTPYVNTDPRPRGAGREISTQTPSEMRRIMKRQEGRARNVLKSSRRFTKA